MTKIGLHLGIGRLLVGASVALLAFGAQAQTSDALNYKLIDGVVYAYEPSNPDSLYRIPNMTPAQAGLAGEVDAQARAAADRAAALNQANTNVNPYLNQSGYGFPYLPPPLPPKPIASTNSALPALTFRDPVFSPQNLPRLNPIGGLPRYPGKNYNTAPW